jgi:hypothetical protein
MARQLFLTFVGIVGVIVAYWYVYEAVVKLPPGTVSDSVSFSRATANDATRQVIERLDCYACTKGGKEAGSARDCGDGQGSFCTKSQPCTPCPDLDVMNADSSAIACRTCTYTAADECHFSAKLGPYCTVVGSDGEKSIEPCDRCCTPPAVLDTGAVDVNATAVNDTLGL